MPKLPTKMIGEVPEGMEADLHNVHLFITDLIHRYNTVAGYEADGKMFIDVTHISDEARLEIRKLLEENGFKVTEKETPSEAAPV